MKSEGIPTSDITPSAGCPKEGLGKSRVVPNEMLPSTTEMRGREMRVMGDEKERAERDERDESDER